MTRALEGKSVAESILRTARDRVDRGRAEGHPPPALVSVHRGESTPFSVYLKHQAATAASAGIEFRSDTLPSGAGAETLRSRIRALDADARVDAVLLEHPLPASLDFLGAVQGLRPEKDVDGVSPLSLGLLLSHRTVQAPAVALGALALARHHGVRIAGRRVAVVGRSETVGLPLALLLLSRDEGANATVTVAHSRTPDLSAALAGAEVIFSCAGVPGLLNRATVPKGAAVIDVGLSTVPDPTKASGVRMAGDGDAAALDGWAESLTPVPGGVGPVTVAQLMANAVHGWELLTRGDRA